MCIGGVELPKCQDSYMLSWAEDTQQGDMEGTDATEATTNKH